MGRNITFRAWDEKGKRWLHGYEPKGLGCSIFGEVMVCGGWLSEVGLEGLNDVTVEQCTGLKDKNGAEIYEGDIVAEGATGGRYWDDEVVMIKRPVGLVEFKAPGFDIRWRQMGTMKDKDGETTPVHISTYDGIYQWPEDVEIIGNRHENAELMKGDPVIPLER